MLMLLQAIPLSTGGSGAAPAAPATAGRGEPTIIEVTILTTGESSADVAFNDLGNPDRSLSVTLPGDAVITDAQFDLFGSHVLVEQGTIEKDFSAHPNPAVDGRMWGGYMATPTGSSPNTLKTNAFEIDSTQISDAAYEDGITISLGALDDSVFNLFWFNITKPHVTKMDFYFAGYANQIKANPWGNYFNFTMHLWNFTSTSWVSDPSFTVTTKSTVVNHYHSYFNGSSLCDHLVSPGSGGAGVYGLAVSPRGLSNQVDLVCDYTSLNATWAAGVYPASVALDIGDDGDDDWTSSPPFKGLANVNDALYGTVDEFQEYIDAQGSSGDVDVPLALTAGSKGVVTISNISVSYFINAPPTFLELPNSTSIDEDSGWAAAFDLDAYFNDDIDAGELTYGVATQGTHVNLGIDPDGHTLNVTTVTGDWFGVDTVQVSAADTGDDGVAGTSDDNVVVSNVLEITVVPIDDPPVIQTVQGVAPAAGLVTLDGSLAALQGSWYNFSVASLDIDGDDFIIGTNRTDGKDGDDMDNFVVWEDGKSGGFLPRNGDVGTVLFTVTVTEVNDSATPKLKDTVDVALVVSNINDAPTLTVPDVTALEDAWTNITITASDPDKIFGDEGLEFGSDLGEVIAGLEDGDTLIHEPGSRVMSILPDNSMVGVYTVEYTVEDLGGRQARAEAQVTVVNTNDVPVAGITAPDKGAVIHDNQKVTLDGSGTTDDDLIHGDVITYAWTVADALGAQVATAEGMTADIGPLAGGGYEVTLTVTDVALTSDVHRRDITVLPAGDGPVVAPGYGVSLEVTPAALDIRPGHSRTVTATVTNDGDNTDVIIPGVTSGGLATADIEQKGAEVNFASGESKVLIVTISVAEGASDGDNYQVVVTAVSMGSGMLVMDSAAVNVTVSADAPVDEPPDGGGGGDGGSGDNGTDDKGGNDGEEGFNWLPVLIAVVLAIVLVLVLVMFMGRKKRLEGLREEARELIDRTEANMRTAGSGLPAETREEALAGIDSLKSSAEGSDAGKIEGDIKSLRTVGARVSGAVSVAASSPPGAPETAPAGFVVQPGAPLQAVAGQVSAPPAAVAVQPGAPPAGQAFAPDPAMAAQAVPPDPAMAAQAFAPDPAMAAQAMPPGAGPSGYLAAAPAAPAQPVQAMAAPDTAQVPAGEY